LKGVHVKQHPGMDALERQRRDLQTLSRRMGRTQDYLDRGRPSPEERAEIEARIEEKRRVLAEMERRYVQHLNVLRQTAPDVVRAWVERHLATLDLLKQIPPPDPPPNFDLSLREFVAEQAAEAWREVLAGARDVVYINSYYLADYEQQFDALDAR
jgi:hypothetical protein